MDEKSVSSSRSWKKRLGCLALWMLGVFLIGSLVLIGISLPNLTREVSPPEISGPRQLEKTARDGETTRPGEDETTPRPDDAPTSRTVILDASGREILNLRDFPHLSPTMRYLAEEWIVAWKELNLEAGTVSDSTTRTLIQEKMQRLVEGMKRYWDLPRAWENATHHDSIYKIIEIERENSLNLGILSTLCRINEVGSPEEWAGLKSIHRNMEGRMVSELAIQDGEWDFAISSFRQFVDDSSSSPMTQQCWEDEIFCWRQMGLAGRIGLVARSYDKRLPQRESNLENYLMTLPSDTVIRMMADYWRRRSRN